MLADSRPVQVYVIKSNLTCSTIRAHSWSRQERIWQTRRCVPDAFPLLTTARTQKFGASKAVWEEVAATVWARIPESRYISHTEYTMHDCFAHTVFSTFSHAELAWRRRLGFAPTYALCGATIAARIRRIIIPNFNAAQDEATCSSTPCIPEIIPELVVRARVEVERWAFR